MENKKLYKSNIDKKLDGVCAGIANYFGMILPLYVLGGFL